MTLDLHAEALAFAQQIQDLLDAVLPLPPGAGSRTRQVDALHLPARRDQDEVRYAVQIGEDIKPGAVPLLKGQRPVASLGFTFQCTHDSSQKYLAVQQSTFELHEEGDRIPLLRLDFLKSAYKIPTAHWNVHAERGSMSRLLARSNPDHVGLLSKVHLPVGGSRMRPCLEDMLQLCLVELAIDHQPGAMEAIEAGRERWRRSQTAALVRDAPDEAARVLADLGYQVVEPAAGLAAANEKALRNW